MADKYGATRDSYCYADSDVLNNLLGITEQEALDAAEAELTQWRLERYEPPDFTTNPRPIRHLGISLLLFFTLVVPY